MSGPHQLRIAQATLFVVRRGAVLARDSLVPDVAKAGSGPTIAVPVLLAQAVVHTIVHWSNHPRTYFCLVFFRGGVEAFDFLLSI